MAVFGKRLASCQISIVRQVILMSKKQKKEPVKTPVKIDKESAIKSLGSFHQSQKKLDYLKKFEEENPVDDLFGEGTKELGDKVISLMKKGDITYEQAYACLQYVYNKLKFESNFLKI